MNEFINPKSMATPGAAGAMVMFVANSICFQFPELPFRWTAILLSFLAGAIVFSAKELQLSHRAAFWVLNSLIIFSVGVGTSNIAAKIQQSSNSAQSKAENTLLDLILPVANALPASDQSRDAPLPETIESQPSALTNLPERQTQSMLDLVDENKRLREEIAKLRANNLPVQVVTPQSSNAAQLLEEQRNQQEAQRLEEQRMQAEEQQRQAEAALRSTQLEAERAAAELSRLEQEQRANEARAETARKPLDGFFKEW